MIIFVFATLIWAFIVKHITDMIYNIGAVALSN